MDNIKVTIKVYVSYVTQFQFFVVILNIIGGKNIVSCVLSSGLYGKYLHFYVNTQGNILIFD